MFDRAHSRSRLAGVTSLAGALALTGGLFVSANAHDVMVDSDPAEGSEVTTEQTGLTLTFNNRPQGIEPRVLVVGDTTGEATVSDISVVDFDLVVTFDEPLPNDAYTVDWRVVSSDGHPIEDELTFSVNVAEPEPTGLPVDEPEVPEDSATPADDEDTAPPVTEPDDISEEDEASSDSSNMLMWVAILGGVIALGSGAAVIIHKQRRHDPDA